MKNKLPVININQRYIKLNIKQKANNDETKSDKSTSLYYKNKRLKNKSEQYKDKFNFSKYNNMKGISLTSLVSRCPKKINIPQIHISQDDFKKPPNFTKKNKPFLRYIQHNVSAKFLSTNSMLDRLSPAPEEINEIKKFNYYDKIEKTKIYQDFLKKEKEVILKDSVNNSFMDDSNINKVSNKESKRFFKNLFSPRQNIYDSLYLFNPKNMIKLKEKFKNKEQFEKYIVEKYVKQKREHLEDKKELNKGARNIYIILDGDIIINDNYIKGFFMELPHTNEIKLFNKEKRKEIINNILNKSNSFFLTKKPLINIFSPNKEFISDISEIKKDFDFLYASINMVCLGISIITTRPLMNLYDNEFQEDLKENEEKMKEIQKKKEEIIFKRSLKPKSKHKIKKVIKGIRPKYEKYKPHYSFADGESHIENVDYVIYSDDEERKKSKEKKILKNCYLKNDFFLYLNEKDIKNRTFELKKNLNFKETYNLNTNYKKYNPNFDSLLLRYKKEIYQQLKINPNIFKVDPIDSKINSHNLEFPDDKLTKLYISRRNPKKIKFQSFQNNYLKKTLRSNNKYSYDPFYHNLHRNVNKYYNPFILHNIPKLLSEFKNFTRKRLYELYSKYKDIITMSYSKNKSKYILQNGVDFDTFWRCIENFSNEKKEFATKIYNQINRREICFLSLEDFLTGMYYMHNSDLSKKLDLFLKMLDKSGKGSISFNEAVNICKESIQRSFGEKGDSGKQDESALNQMSEFFAGFVFQLIGVDKRNNLNLEDLRKAFISKETELNEFEYLEMFCGANI